MHPFVSLDGIDPHVSSFTPIDVMLLRLVLATVLSAAVSYRPWRMFMKNMSRVAYDTAQAQVIIAVAGAIMVIIIGDSVARAFGLVGLGAFIRFRSGIKDPRDAAVMFVMIGVGMAVGLGLYEVAAVVSAFIAVVVATLDIVDRNPARKIRVGIELAQGAYLLEPFRPVFPGARVIEVPHGAGGGGRLVLEIDSHEAVDAGMILATLERHGIPGVRNVALVDD